MWINTKDELPPICDDGGHESDFVLANESNIIGTGQFVGWYDHLVKKWYVFHYLSGNNCVDVVSHWMPLPPNPSNEDQHP